MSLTSEFEITKTKLQQVEDITQAILDGNVPFKNQNQWHICYYNKRMSTAPNLSDIKGLTPTKEMYKSLTQRDTNWAWGDYYVGYLECWVYCKSSYKLKTQFWTDDYGRFCLNGISIATSGSCVATDVTIPFKKGLNHIEILFQEGSGGDGGHLKNNLYDQSFVKWVYAQKL